MKMVLCVSWKVEYYKTESGKTPAYDFIVGLPVKMRAKAFREIALLEELGTKIKMPYSRPMGDGIHELRIQFAGDISRVFYFFFVRRKIILTNGFIKKTDQTPPEELQTARDYKSSFERRNKT